MAGKINEVDEVATNVAAISEEQAASSDEILAHKFKLSRFSPPSQGLSPL